MILFWKALLQYPFLQCAVAAGLLISVACGVVGSYVVTRRISYIAGSISHCVLAGLGAARYLQVVYDYHWLHPLYGALVAATVSATVIAFVSLRARQREDTVIGAVWAVGMALGVLFISRTPGYPSQLMGYLFGSILILSPRELWLIAGLDCLVLGVVVVFYRPLLCVCFDEEFARSRGLAVERYYVLLLILTALTVVLLATVVGIILVIALLTIPAAIAGYFSRSLKQMMIAAAGLCALFTTLGLAVMYEPNLPPGATIILIAGSTYLVAAGVAAWVRGRTSP
jgi:zinc transport system permease protein